MAAAAWPDRPAQSALGCPLARACFSVLSLDRRDCRADPALPRAADRGVPRPQPDCGITRVGRPRLGPAPTARWPGLASVPCPLAVVTAALIGRCLRQQTEGYLGRGPTARSPASAGRDSARCRPPAGPSAVATGRASSAPAGHPEARPPAQCRPWAARLSSFPRRTGRCGFELVPAGAQAVSTLG